LPYIRRDGRLSPDVELYDRKRWERAADGIVTTAKAAYFLDEPRFAEEAVTRVRRWFLDAETRMNSHLRYASMIPGRCTGRQYGVIDFSIYLPTVLDHIRLLANLDESPWTAEDQRGMVAWCNSFLKWLENDQFGRKEEAAPNNHSVYYDRTKQPSLVPMMPEHYSIHWDYCRRPSSQEYSRSTRVPSRSVRHCP
jgi:hypothetical protein